MTTEELKKDLLDSHNDLWDTYVSCSKDSTGLVQTAKDEFARKLDLLIETTKYEEDENPVY